MFIQSSAIRQRRITVCNPDRFHSASLDDRHRRKSSLTPFLPVRKPLDATGPVKKRKRAVHSTNFCPFEVPPQNKIEEYETSEFDEINSEQAQTCPSLIASKKKVSLKIRGQLFQTFECTLNNFPDTLLGNKMSRDKFYNELTDEYIFDRCQYSFDAILFYYQSKGILARPSNIQRDLFLKELEFYMITECLDERHRCELDYIEEDKKNKTLPSGRFRPLIWKVLEFQSQSIMTRCVFYFCFLVSLLSIIAFCAETVPQYKSMRIWQLLETSVSIIFTLEYALRIYASPRTKDFVLSPNGTIDLLAIIPYYLNLAFHAIGLKKWEAFPVLAFTRVLRVFKLVRFHEGLRMLMVTLYESLYLLLSLMLSIMIASFLFATLLYHAEFYGLRYKSKFKTISDSFWYTVITATGVGYGDIYPETIMGRLIGACLATFGVLLFCLPTPMLVNKFVECYYLRENLIGDIDQERQQVMIRMRKTFLDDNDI